MKRDAFTLPLAFPGELIIDNFAGGGGTSTGLEAAFGRPVDIAINHDPEALAMHAINHPHTQHLCESVWDVDPIAVTGNQPVGLVWLSPDCKHFSKAKGGTPVAKHIRGLAWVGMRWVALCKPRVLMLENVEEFQTWGPLLVGADGTARPDPARKGKTFQSFVRQLRAHGYAVDWRELRACDNGAPTIRKRLFLIARRDGLPIQWPEQTHAAPTDRRVLAGKLAPYRTAAECIDFSLEAASIFDRPRPLAINTQRRVAKGLFRHVLTSAAPFIVGVGGRMGQSPARSVHTPAQTITAKADSCIAQPVLTPYMVNTRNGERAGQQPRVRSAQAPYWTVTGLGSQGALAAPVIAPLRGTSEQHLQCDDAREPLSTVSAGGTHHALAGAVLAAAIVTNTTGHPGATADTPLATITTGGHHAMAAMHITKFNTGSVGSGLDEPLRTVTAGGTPSRPSTGIQMGMVSAFLEQANGGFYDGDGRPVGAPASTITSSGAQQRLVTAYLVKYYSEGGQDSACGAPMHTVPTKARMGLVQTVQVPADCLAPEHQARARQCAELLHTHLPEQFPDPAGLVLMQHAGQWWVLVDITLRMLKPVELFRAQGFPEDYVIHEIPDPALLFAGGKQAAHPLEVPRIPLTATAQVRMCGNSVSPPQAEALVRANFGHETDWMAVAA
ncbi:DNA cytosine methyltransferase [Paracidovorax citrulli]|uniref:DNA cytosine methyltransferase n=1 Tax=Paracidovorax citrulli TaxID=80869 RepID=UPI001F100523|nr:DNA cytosine methyltransferase [Paracidovorax citrulli]UMT84004.1 DNA methyltransferase [Paracidovorax citrulli]WIY32368.1 DNA cytosine methyltransferase [Paracidovorax citrulli]